jgi:hypothetical protein
MHGDEFTPNGWVYPAKEDWGNLAARLTYQDYTPYYPFAADTPDLARFSSVAVLFECNTMRAGPPLLGSDKFYSDSR